MNNISIVSDIYRGTVSIRDAATFPEPTVRDSNGTVIRTPILRKHVCENGDTILELDAANLRPWTPATPVLYTLETDGKRVRFGHVDIRADGAALRVNGAPFYFRGYIRGITAHDHPNLTGLSTREFFRKNIMQARKYGFNLVRFHSTIPDEEFVELADELGIFIHMEIGYRHEYGADGAKKGIIIDEKRWRETILRFRNHPSVAIFCLGNEMHNSGRNPEALRMYRLGRELAPSRLIMDNAGWGEFDRRSADAFIQHIAYYFPFKHHASMFDQDFCWKMNGSAHQVPLSASATFRNGEVSVRRQLNPVRPVIAHECVHYIDIPDYAELNRKFDAFAAHAGAEYLAANGIEKPRYLTELPELIAAKRLEARMPDYIKASQHFKKLAIKAYIERLRLSNRLCGFEMLQLSDCLKYENKNGIIDCFDDDKFISADWMRQFNSDLVLLADFPKENFLAGEEATIPIHLSNYCDEALPDCTLRLSISRRGGEREVVYQGDHFSPVGGLAKIIDMTISLGKSLREPAEHTLEAELLAASGRVCRNQWTFWIYPQLRLDHLPSLELSEPGFRDCITRLAHGAQTAHGTVVCDLLNDAALSHLESGRTVILNYHRDRSGKQYYLPGTLDRFKPCIWDRGSNLGGIVTVDWLQKAIGAGMYFDKNHYHLIEAAYKINLDHFPCAVNEMVWGVDKPVRDRMKGLIHGIKKFLPDDTLRNFSYLFSVRVGKGLLVLCSFNFSGAASDPAVASALCALINSAPSMDTGHAVEMSFFKRYLQDVTEKGPVKEDVMNHFWEIDNKPVEDTLFWEEARLDLRKMSSAVER